MYCFFCTFATNCWKVLYINATQRMGKLLLRLKNSKPFVYSVRSFEENFQEVRSFQHEFFSGSEKSWAVWNTKEAFEAAGTRTYLDGLWTFGKLAFLYAREARLDFPRDFFQLDRVLLGLPIPAELWFCEIDYSFRCAPADLKSKNNANGFLPSKYPVTALAERMNQISLEVAVHID